jgi:hypothetical protein
VYGIKHAFQWDITSSIFKNKFPQKVMLSKINPTDLEKGLLDFINLLFHILPVLLVNFTH